VRAEAETCVAHGKKLEAFCQLDRETLCIDCILSDAHRSHEISALQKAVWAERDCLRGWLAEAAEVRRALEQQEAEAEEHVRAVRERAERRQSEVEALFREVRAAVEEREAALLREIRSALDREEEAMAQAARWRQEAARRIQAFQIEACKAEGEPEIVTLQRAKERAHMGQEALQAVPKLTFGLVIEDLKREHEI
jgi:hypothetical protein